MVPEPILPPAGAHLADIIVENRPASLPQRAWVTIGLPEPIARGTPVKFVSGAIGFPAVADHYVVHVSANLDAGVRLRGKLLVADVAPPPFGLSPWVSDQPEALVPSFSVDGMASNPVTYVGDDPGTVADFLRLIESCPARLVFHWRTRIVPASITLEGWTYVYSGQDMAQITVRATYGTTATGQPRDRVFGSLKMVVGEEPVIDFLLPKGLHAPIRRTDGKWEAELVAPGSWLRARTHEITGALLCRQTASDNADDQPRLDNLEARRSGPITGQCSRANWEGHYGAFGKVPALWQDASTEQARRWESFRRLLTTSGSDDSARPYTQPPNSGQTGEQPGFGASHELLAFEEPWFLHACRWSVQSYTRRPYANREPDGKPVAADRHPGAATYNLRPDERFGTDMLGWPKPVGWISGYTTSDSQHREDNLLHAMFLATRDHSIARTIEDIIECERMALKQPDPVLGSGLGSPRGWGRPLVAQAHMLRSGYGAALPLILETVRRAYLAAQFRVLPSDPTHTVHPLSTNESKYGWNDTTGARIRAWLPWQEAIAIMGFYAAYKVVPSDAVRDLCVIPARTIVRHGFYQLPSGAWQCCYAVRWRTDNPAAPLPDAAYPANGQPNMDVYPYGIQRWVLPALAILERLDPDGPATPRAREILAAYGVPRRWDDSRWWAV